MSEHAQRRRGTGAGASPLGTPDLERDVADFAALLGGRLGHVDDGLALSSVLTSAQRVVALVESRGLDREVSLRVREQVDLGASLHRVLQAHRMAFTARGVALTTEPAPGVFVTVDELGLDVAISVLCCWSVLRAVPGSEVHAAVRAVPDRPRVRFHIGTASPEDGCIRVARSLAVAIGGALELDEVVGVAELTLAPA
jgi:hypothetical protein